MENTLYYGDNLDILIHLTKTREPFIDLIYIDPPFNSKRNYNILFQDLIMDKENGNKIIAQKEAFKDTWSNIETSDILEKMQNLDNLNIYKFLSENRYIFTDSQMSYLTMMAIRIYYMRKLLKDTGSFYLHCDPTMSHYLKILLDIIFGVKNFKNEIVWKRAASKQKGSQFKEKTWSPNTDSIFFYVKSEQYKLNPLNDISNLSKEEVEKKFNHIDKKGQRYNINTPIFCAKSMGERPNLCYEWRGFKNPHPSGWRLSKEKLEEEYKKGNIVIRKDGKLERRKYLKDYRGVPVGSLWSDIIPISQGKERLGYPTQKPKSLLERIIKASSDEGDVVADFFCGCGTTIIASEELKRRWLGVDINHLAVGLIEEKRLKPLKANYKVEGFPKDIKQAEKLAMEKPFEFEQWIVEYVLKGHKTKKTADGGYDGYIYLKFQSILNNKIEIEHNHCILEVKGGSCTVKNLREFENVIDKQKASMGIFICFEKRITKEMIKHCNNSDTKNIAGLFKTKKVSILTIESILKKEFPNWLEHIIENFTYF